MKTRFSRFLMLGSLALLMSACRILVDTHIETDGSGELRSLVVYSAEERENFAKDPANEGKSICDSAREDIPADATFVEEEHDGETYCGTVRTFRRLSELEDLYATMGNVMVNELTIGLGRFVFDVDVDRTQDENQEGQPIETEWRLTVPGTLESHNGDRAEGKMVIWAIPSGKQTNLRAESSVPLDSSIFQIAGAGCLGLVLGILLIAFLFRRGRAPEP